MSELGTGEFRDPRIPLSSLILAYGPMLPFPLAAIGWALAPPKLAHILLWAVICWGSAILVFLAGVRRGLSFDGRGANRAELMLVMWLFLLGIGALVSRPFVLFAAMMEVPISPALPLALLVLGFATVAIVDPVSARRGRAPAHFETLRLPQMCVALVGLLALFVEWSATSLPI